MANSKHYTNEYLPFAKEMANDMVEQMKEFVSPLGLVINVLNDYDFSHKKWLAIYAKSMGGIKENRIDIAINFEAIYRGLKKLGAETKKSEIDAQVGISVAHEVGHGIIDYLRSHKDKYNSDIAKSLIKLSKKDEEIEAERFGEYQFRIMTEVYESKINDFLATI